MSNEASQNAPTNIEVQMNFSSSVNSAVGKAETVNVNPKQSLADSAAEIQQLLQLLNRSYPENLPADTQAEIEVAVNGIEKNPALKERVMAALKAGGVEALKELTDNAYVNILVAAYEGFQNP
ncbi:MAG: hypothetical protein J7545_21840 [Roseofilum sp. SBFL]|nr:MULTISPECIES: hypothetical protein [unclassified Roseofilum]MBP0015232.1 hypothetical protein [Roseofilum sp. SID3]MBP0044580.1 hypothetical protein [Roseofilum sp. SBFL]HBR00672.1 hypothetical protein [Cyanobacteria bacterium UBA11691]MBP0024508.1 hypothetical protein [Roseofilum sp. SID2]MBP0038785.1 hypothetical protein [Roseofilum sp. SID1]